MKQYLMSKLRDEKVGYREGKDKVRDGEVELSYFHIGKIVLRGRTPMSLAYKLSIKPDGFLGKTFDRNFNTLKGIIESHKIKLTRVKEQ